MIAATTRYILCATISLPLLGDELVNIIGRRWHDPSIQQQFASNVIKNISSTVIYDAKINITETNKLYILSHPTENRETFWDECCGYPSLPYTPYLKITTVSGSASYQQETIAAITLFNSKLGEKQLPSFIKALDIPSFLFDAPYVNTPHSGQGIQSWLWKDPVIHEASGLANSIYDNDPIRGKITYNSVTSNCFVKIWFGKQSFYNIQLVLNDFQRDLKAHTLATNTFDLSFIRFNKPWLISVNTNAQPSRAQRLNNRDSYSLSHYEEGMAIRTKMTNFGFDLMQRTKHREPHSFKHYGLYSSQAGDVLIETGIREFDTRTCESIQKIIINFKSILDPNKLILPQNLILPGSRKDCAQHFKICISQESLDGNRVFLGCLGASFVFEEDKLIEAIYTNSKRCDTEGIFGLYFN
jgi:hypothetical protein